MTYVTTEPQLLAAAAADAAGIGSTINEASAAAAGRITGVAAPAVDEVSAATATLFNGYADEFRALLDQAEAFHARFAEALSAAGIAYARAEAANAASAANVDFGHGRQRQPESAAKLRECRCEKIHYA